MGQFGSDEIDNVFDYYGIPFEPTVIFNGLEMISGGGNEIETGQPYLDVVTPEMFVASPIKLEINSFDPESGDFSVTGTMYSPDEDVIDASIRFILVEDNIDESYTHVVRDIMKDDFDLSGQGNTISYEKTFEIPPECILSNVRVVAFVQMNDHEIIQSTSNYQIPDFKVRAMVPFETTYFDPDYDPESGNYLFEGDFFSIVNLGFDDDLTIDLIIDDAPENWSFTYSDEEFDYEDSSDFSLLSDDNKNFRVNISPCSYGSADYHFEITSANSNYVYNIPFTYMNVETNIENEFTVSDVFLEQNFPNPFKISTTIFFHLNAENMKNSEINIYNLKGQQIRQYTILDNQSSFFWDGKDKNGKIVTPGIYLYMLSGENIRITKKMILIK